MYVSERYIKIKSIKLVAKLIKDKSVIEKCLTEYLITEKET